MLKHLWTKLLLMVVLFVCLIFLPGAACGAEFTLQPSATLIPTATATPVATIQAQPSATATVIPTERPTSQPTDEPTAQSTAKPTVEPTAISEYAIISARDEYGELLPGEVVNVWDDYETRGRVVARCSDEESVEVLQHSGNGVQIRTQQGVVGWVSRWFLIE